jgi:tetratricopeptide (TPR) repeat protein
VSVINKMLRDLDRRRALPESASADPSVRVVPQVRRSDAFWITMGIEALVAIGALIWVVYELQPRPLATPLALSRPAVPPPAPIAAIKPPPPPAAPPKEAAPAAAPPPPVEMFKLAEAIETPIPPPAARKQLPKPAKLPPDQAIALPSTAPKGSAPEAVSKRNRPLSSVDEAEIRFQKGVDRLNQGRPSAAAQEFAAALAVQPAYEPARQALVAVRLEQSEIDEAEKLLTDGMAISPSNAQFATVLARIRVERGDYEGAADLLARTETGANDAEHQLLFATVLQRLGRHADALAVFENAARLAEPTAAAWIAMGISYENVGAKPQALRSDQQSLAAGPTDALRGYAESRIRALK